LEDTIVISAESLTKTYRLYDVREDRVKEAFHPLRKKYHKPFNALDSISFDVRKGETFGIIGRNGSGKSTLLQLISGVLRPTSGRLYVNGKVSALLELGTGFNPEFTGRENIFINGSILGLKRETLENRMEEILSFADIGDFINQPVKTYSSGMYIRLAFAIAINVAPDILVVDEALAVGDMYFQHKCMNRMQQLIREGCTLIFVSHDMGSVKSLCRRALFLDNGRAVCIGDAEKVTNRYYYSLIEKDENMDSNLPAGDGPDAADPQKEALPSGPGRTDPAGSEAGKALSPEREAPTDPTRGQPVFSADDAFIEKVRQTRSGTGEARIQNVRVVDSQGRGISACGFGDKIAVQVHVKFFRDVEDINIGFLVKDKNGIELIGTNLLIEKIPIRKKKAGDAVVTEFRFENILKDGTYSLTVAVGKSDERGRYNVKTYDLVDNAAVFKVETPVDKHIASLVSIPVEIEIA